MRSLTDEAQAVAQRRLHEVEQRRTLTNSQRRSVDKVREAATTIPGRWGARMTLSRPAWTRSVCSASLNAAERLRAADDGGIAGRRLEDPPLVSVRA